MNRTGLTVGGFTQPTVARSLIELQQSVEKGLAQRFLWIMPKPTYSKFCSLESVDETFYEYLGWFHNLCACMWIWVYVYYVVYMYRVCTMYELIHNTM